MDDANVLRLVQFTFTSRATNTSNSRLTWVLGWLLA